MDLRTLELFCGTKSFSKACWQMGHKTLTVDNNQERLPDKCMDILSIVPEVLKDNGYKFDFIWASPPCTSFSVMTISKNWRKEGTEYIPISDGAKLGMALVQKTLDIIGVLKPTYWVIENPRAMLRKMPFMEGLCRNTITYCQYGELTMKPTDLWGDFPPTLEFKSCNYGAPCHKRTPRGSNTSGIQALKSPLERGMIPQRFCMDVVRAMEIGGEPLKRSEIVGGSP